jgi:hypothetical protein
MKTTNQYRKSAAGVKAFTVAETLVVMGLIVIVGTALIFCNMFGLSMAVRQQIWMDASSDTARTMGTVMNDIKSGVVISIGNYSNGLFVPVPDGTNQWGDAIRIGNAATTNVPPWIDYYYSASTSNLMRTNYNGPGVAGSYSEISANPITNDQRIFTGENYAGTVVNQSVKVAVVDVYLSYIKLQNPQVLIGPGNLLNLYMVRTRVTPRSTQ